MSNTIHPLALFRLSVLGPLASRDKLERGELKAIIQNLAEKTYNIPGSKRTHLHPQTIEQWYYAWKRGGIDALIPKIRKDKDKSRLDGSLGEALIRLKRDNPSRSINTLISLLEKQGIIATGELSRATVHRFLKLHHLSRRTLSSAETIERRSFVADHAGDIWYGDVMHGPHIPTQNGMRKVYLVSLIDDASRLIAHSAFCFAETALEIEGVLKQAILKRGLPKKLVIDNGAAYRSDSLQGICARLKIRLVYCRPYEPEGKGKIERYHRTFRELFLNELNLQAIHNIGDLNARLWVWVEQMYHQRPHEGLKGQTPLNVWRRDLIHIQSLGSFAQDIDHFFYHRFPRRVRKDGTISWNGKSFEVPYECSGQNIILVADPHTEQALWIEDEQGNSLGGVTPLDLKSNLQRYRQRPEVIPASPTSQVYAVEEAYNQYLQTVGSHDHLTEEK